MMYVIAYEWWLHTKDYKRMLLVSVLEYYNA